MIKLKMQDAVVEMSYLNITCWDFTEENPDLYHIGAMKNIKSTYDELTEKWDDINYDDFHLYINSQDYSINYKMEKDAIIIECVDLTLEELKKEYTDEDILSIDTKLSSREDILINRWKDLRFKQFKDKFGLKGTKKKLIEKYKKEIITEENRDNNFYLTFSQGRCNMYYELNKDVQEGKYLVYYSCTLGTV